MLGVDAPPAWVGTAQLNAFVDPVAVDGATTVSDAAVQ
jgi:hypothetical protein